MRTDAEELIVLYDLVLIDSVLLGFKIDPFSFVSFVVYATVVGLKPRSMQIVCFSLGYIVFLL